MNKNILLAGIGGQGVNALSKSIQRSCIREGFYCKSSIFKGGAQKRGAIYSFIRIFNEKNEETINFGGEIGSGELDLMISLEYWETIRYMKYYNLNTEILANMHEIAFFSKRYSKELSEVNPKKILKDNFKNTKLEDYSKISIKHFGNERMINLIMGIEATANGMLPINKEVFIEEFIKQVNLSKENILKIKSYVDARN